MVKSRCYLNNPALSVNQDLGGYDLGPTVLPILRIPPKKRQRFQPAYDYPSYNEKNPPDAREALDNIQAVL